MPFLFFLELSLGAKALAAASASYCGLGVVGTGAFTFLRQAFMIQLFWYSRFVVPMAFQSDSRGASSSLLINLALYP